MTTVPDLFTMSDSDPLSSQETILELRLGSEDWKLEGVCRTVDPDLWFPEGPTNATAAKLVCAMCPVIDECLTYALKNNERFGVWGGKTGNERRKIRRDLGYTRGYFSAPAV